MINDYLNEENYGDKLKLKGLSLGEADKPLEGNDLNLENLGGIVSDAPAYSRRSTDSSYGIEGEISPYVSPDEAIEEGGYQDMLAKQQSAGAAIGSATVQTLSEAVLGMAEGVGTIGAGILDLGASAFGQTESKFMYDFMNTMESLKDDVRDVAPIYMTKEQERETFSPYSGMWWLKNTPQLIGSTLSLMIPSAAIGGVAGKALAGGFKAGSKAAKAARITGYVGGSALSSRFMENMQEANEARNGAIERLTNQGLSYQDASEMASKEAADVFTRDNALVAIDALQFGLGAIPALGKIPKGVAAAFDMFGEGVEETWQSVSQKEAELKFEHPQQYNDTSIFDRLSDYAHDDEILASAVLGAAGGGIFAFGSLGKKGISKLAKPASERISDAIDDLNAATRKKALKNDKYKMQLLRDKNVNAAIVRNLRRGKASDTSTMLDSLDNISDETLAKFGATREDVKKAVETYRQDSAAADRLSTDIDASGKFEGNENAKWDYIQNMLDKRLVKRNLSNARNEINSIYSEASSSANPELDSDLANYKKLTDQLKSVNNKLKNINNLKKTKNSFGRKIFSNESIARIKKDLLARQKDLKAEITTEKEGLKANKNVNLKEDNISTSYDEQIDRLNDNILESEMALKHQINPILDGYLKAKNADHVAKRAVEIYKQKAERRSNQIVDRISKAKKASDVFDIMQDISENPEYLDTDKIAAVVNEASDAELKDTEDIDASDGIKSISDAMNHRYAGRPFLGFTELSHMAKLIDPNYDGKSLPKDIIAKIQELYDNKDKDKIEEIRDFLNQRNEYRDSVLKNVTPSDPKNPTTNNNTGQAALTPTDKAFIKPLSVKAYRPDMSVVPEYDMEYNPVTGRVVLKFKDGKLIPGTVASKLSIPIEYDYINTGALSTNKEIRFAINLDIVKNNPDTYHKSFKTKKKLKDNCEILILHTDSEGVDHVVGALPVVRNNPKFAKEVKALESIREKVWNEAETKGYTKGVVKLNTAYTISNIFNGIPNTKSDFSLIPADSDIKLGVATLDKVNRKPIIQIGSTIIKLDSGTTPGAVFAIVKAPDGSNKPIQLFTKKLKDNDKALSDVIELISKSTKQNWSSNREAVNKIVHVDYFVKDGFIKFIYYKNGKKNFTNQIRLDNTAAISKYVGNLLQQVDARRVNDIGYNKSLFENGTLVSNVDLNKPFLNPGFRMELSTTDEIVPTPPPTTPTTPTPPTTTKKNGLTESEAKEFNSSILNNVKSMDDKAYSDAFAKLFSDFRIKHKLAIQSPMGLMVAIDRKSDGDALTSFLMNKKINTRDGAIKYLEEIGLLKEGELKSKDEKPEGDKPLQELMDDHFLKALTDSVDGEYNPNINKLYIDSGAKYMNGPMLIVKDVALSGKIDSFIIKHKLNTKAGAISYFKELGLYEEDEASTLDSSTEIIDIDNTTGESEIVDPNLVVKERGISDDDMNDMDSMFNDAFGDDIMASVKQIEVKTKNAEAWFRKNFPNVNVEIVNGLINVGKHGGIQAYGLFKKGCIELSNLANSEVLIHEAFHQVFNMYLTDSQQRQILNEARFKYGKPSKADFDAMFYEFKNLNNYEPTDQQVLDAWLEEKLADDLVMYVAEDENLTVRGKIKKFFREIYYMIKNVFSKNINIEQLYSNVNTGRYKDSKILNNNTELKARRLVSDMTTSEAVAASRMIAYVISDQITKYHAKLDKTKHISRIDIVNRLGLNTFLRNTYIGLASLIKAKAKSKTWNVNQVKEFDILIDNFATETENGELVFGPLANEVVSVLKEIEGMGLKTDFDAIINLSDTTLEEEIEDLDERLDELEGWQTSTENHSKKESLSSSIRRYLSKISIKGKTDKFGFKVYMDFNQAYATLIDAVTEKFTESEMLDAVKELTKTRPEFTAIYDKLLEDDDFRWDFFSGLQSTKVDYKFVKETTTGSGLNKKTVMSVGSSNRTQLSKVVLEDWRGTFRMLKSSRGSEETIVNSDGTINTELAKKLLAKANEIEANMISAVDYEQTLGPIHALCNLLGEVGLVVAEDERDAIATMSESSDKSKRKLFNTFSNNITGIFTQLSDGVDIFNESGRKDLYTVINNIAKTVAASKIHSYESSFRNSENKTVYAHQIPFELTQWFARFRNRGIEGNKKFYSGSVFFGHSPWIMRLLSSFGLMKNFTFAQFDGYSEEKDRLGTKYSKLSDRQLESANIAMYFNNGNKDYAFYKCPVFSNSPRGVYVQFMKYNTIDGVVSDLARVAKQEVTRIVDIRNRKKQREELIAKGEPIPKELEPIKHYDTENSEQFLLITCLNENLEENINNLNQLTNQDEIRAKIKEWVTAESKKEFERMKEIGVFKTTKDKDGKETVTYKDGRFGKHSLYGDFELYHASSMLAYSQLSTLFTGDVAFYQPNMKKDKNGKLVPDVHRSVDLSKRIKEAVSPKHILNTDATYSLSEDDMLEAGLDPKTDSNVISCGSTYNVAIIQDDEVYDGVYGKAKYDALIASGATPIRAAQIASQYGYSNTEKDGTKYAEADGTRFKTKKINISDGQTFISLDRYRKIMIGSHRWNKELQSMFNRLKKGKGTKGDINTFMTQLKPFMFGMQKIGDTIIPSQHKNSEFVVFPQLAETSEFFKKCLDVFEDKNVDAVSYDSVVKVGLNNVGKDLNSDVVVQEFSNENYGIQQETPEHLQDAEALLGTQIRKLICANLSPNAVFDVKGMKLNKDQLLTLYQGLLFSNVKKSYEKLLKGQEHMSAEDISKLLTQELKDRGYGQDLIEAVKIVKKTDPLTGEEIDTFAVPLYTPTIAKELEQVLHALFKNRVSKQKIKGGAVVQVSGVGYSDELRMHFKETKDTKDGETRKAVDYMDCMMPWHSKKSLELIMDENGHIDIDRLREMDPELLEGIGYRIPTEALYSMAKLRIKGFLPQESGSSIILPMEITTLSGSDFDIDKMFLMLKEFEIKPDREKLRSLLLEAYDALSERGELGEAKLRQRVFNVDRFLDSLKQKPEDKSVDFLILEQVYKFVKDNYKDEFNKVMEFKTISSNYEELGDNLQKGNIIEHLDSLSREQRNNLIVDVFNSVLSNSTSVENFLDPGSFETLRSVKDEILELEGKSNEELPIILPSTQSKIFRRNMDGLTLVGFAANSNSAHAILQHYNVKFANPMKFNGEDLKQLDNVSNPQSDMMISKSLAEFLAAFVDNAKDPIAALLNFNDLTFGVASCMVRMGCSIRTAGLFVNQPATKELIKRTMLAGGGDANLMKEYKKLVEELTGEKIEGVTEKPVNLNDAEMVSNIKSGKKNSNLSIKALNNFMIYHEEQAADMRALSMAVKIDTSHSGPTLAYNDSILKQQRSMVNSRNMYGHRELLLGKTAGALFDGQIDNNPIAKEITKQGYVTVYDEFTDKYVKQDIVNIRFDPKLGRTLLVLPGDGGTMDVSLDILEVSRYAYNNVATEFKYSSLAAFNKYGLVEPTKEVSRVYPWMNMSFTHSISGIEEAVGRSLYTDEIAKVNSEVFQYLCSTTELMNEDSRMDSIYNFPKKYTELKEASPELWESNLFLKKLGVINDKNHTITSVVFYNNGSLTKSEAQDLKDSWLDLLENPETKEFAESLVVYALSKYGFYMSPNSFTHIIPIEFFTENEKGVKFIQDIERIGRIDSRVPLSASGFVKNYLANCGQSFKAVKPPMVYNRGKVKDFDGNVVLIRDRKKRQIPGILGINVNNRNLSSKILKGFLTSGDPILAPYVSYTHEGKVYVFERNEALSSGSVISYTLIEPKGHNGEMFEYSDDRSYVAAQQISAASLNMIYEMHQDISKLANKFGYKNNEMVGGFVEKLAPNVSISNLILNAVDSNGNPLVKIGDNEGVGKTPPSRAVDIKHINSKLPLPIGDTIVNLKLGDNIYRVMDAYLAASVLLETNIKNKNEIAKSLAEVDDSKGILKVFEEQLADKDVNELQEARERYNADAYTKGVIDLLKRDDTAWTMILNGKPSKTVYQVNEPEMSGVMFQLMEMIIKMNKAGATKEVVIDILENEPTKVKYTANGSTEQTYVVTKDYVYNSKFQRVFENNPKVKKVITTLAGRRSNFTIDDLGGDNKTKPAFLKNNYTGLIKELSSDEVFVFGANPEGRHGAGAAKAARSFGATPGKLRSDNTFGLITKDLMGYGNFDKTKIQIDENGEAYYEVNGVKLYSDKVIYDGVTYMKPDGPTNKFTINIPGEDEFDIKTVSLEWRSTMPLEFMQKNISILYDVAKDSPNKIFRIAYSKDGRLLNGHTVKEMASAFANAGEIPSNISFEKGFSELVTEAMDAEPSKKGDAESIDGLKVVEDTYETTDYQVPAFENETEEQAATRNKIQELVDFAKENVTFNEEDHKYFINGKAAKKSVTQLINPTGGMSSNNLWSTPSSTLGNTVDLLVRDFFLGIRRRNYPNLSEEQLNKIYDSLKTIKTKFDNDGVKIISHEFPLVARQVVNGKAVAFAGTVDLLGYDKDGNVRVYDIKTYREPKVDAVNTGQEPKDDFGRTWAQRFGGKDNSKIDKYSKQLTTYALMLTANGLNVVETSVMPFKLSYADPYKVNVSYSTSGESKMAQLNANVKNSDKKYPIQVVKSYAAPTSAVEGGLFTLERNPVIAVTNYEGTSPALLESGENDNPDYDAAKLDEWRTPKPSAGENVVPTPSMRANGNTVTVPTTPTTVPTGGSSLANLGGTASKDKVSTNTESIVLPSGNVAKFEMKGAGFTAMVTNANGIAVSPNSLTEEDLNMFNNHRNQMLVKSMNQNKETGLKACK